MPRGPLALAVAGALALASPAAAFNAHRVVVHTLIGGQPALVAEHDDPLPGAAGDTAAARARLGGVPPAATFDGPALAESWCGTQRTSDDTADDADPPGTPRMKIIYAYAADQPDRFTTYANQIQADAQFAMALIAQASGQRKTVRFDRGTDCAQGNPAAFVDIQVVHLPRPLAYYRQGATGAATVNLVAPDVSAALGTQSAGPRNYVVYADQIFPAGGTVAGTGQQRVGAATEVPGPENVANSGGLYAFVWGVGSPSFNFRTDETLTHEMSHTLGAVQPGAPDATGAGHCTDEWDVMCYADGGPKGAAANLVLRCADPANSVYDCNRDDYFNPAPAAGSYLATHWNLFNSVFMCEVAAPCDQPSQPPTASITVDSRRVTGSSLVVPSGVPLDFESAATDPEGDIDRWQWGFTGQAPATTPEVTRTFRAGSGAVVLRVRDEAGNANARRLQPFAVLAHPLSVQLSATPSKPVRRAPVRLTAVGTDRDTAPIVEYAWDFDGDGETDLTTTRAAVSHTYDSVDVVEPTVTVTDAFGAAAHDTIDLHVSLSPQEQLPLSMRTAAAQAARALARAGAARLRSAGGFRVPLSAPLAGHLTVRLDTSRRLLAAGSLHVIRPGRVSPRIPLNAAGRSALRRGKGRAGRTPLAATLRLSFRPDDGTRSATASAPATLRR